MTGALRGLVRVAAAAVLAALVAWGATELQPGGAATAAARAAGLWPPDDAPPARRDTARALARARFGLDGAASTRLARRAAALLLLDLGASWRDGARVGPRVATALAWTGLAATAALALAAGLGVALGLRAGARPGGLGDRALGGATALAGAIPPVWALALALGVLASAGRVIEGHGVSGLAATVLAVGVPLALVVARHARGARTELARSPLLVAVASRGLPPSAATRHARAVLWSGLLGVLAALAPWAIGAVLAVEHLLGARGLGALLVPAAVLGDAPSVAGVAAATGALGAASAALLSGLARAADPRRAEVPR